MHGHLSRHAILLKMRILPVGSFPSFGNFRTLKKSLGRNKRNIRRLTDMHHFSNILSCSLSIVQIYEVYLLLLHLDSFYDFTVCTVLARKVIIVFYSEAKKHLTGANLHLQLFPKLVKLASYEQFPNKRVM